MKAVAFQFFLTISERRSSVPLVPLLSTISLCRVSSVFRHPCFAPCGLVVLYMAIRLAELAASQLSGLMPGAGRGSLKGPPMVRTFQEGVEWVVG